MESSVPSFITQTKRALSRSTRHFACRNQMLLLEVNMLLFSARLRRAQVTVWKVFARLLARKNLPHCHKKARLRAKPSEEATCGKP